MSRPPGNGQPQPAAATVQSTMTHLAQIDDAQIRFNNEKVGIYRGFAPLDGGVNEQTVAACTGVTEYVVLNFAGMMGDPRFGVGRNGNLAVDLGAIERHPACEYPTGHPRSGCV